GEPPSVSTSSVPAPSPSSASTSWPPCSAPPPGSRRPSGSRHWTTCRADTDSERSHRARTLAPRPGGTPASRWGGTPPLRLDGTPALSSSRTPASKWGGASTTDRRTTSSGRDQSREQVPRDLWNRFFESGCSEGRTEPGLSGSIRSCAGELPPWWEAPDPTGAARCCHGQGNPRRRQHAHSPAEGAGAVPLHVRDRARRGALRRGRELLRLGRKGAAV